MKKTKLILLSMLALALVLGLAATASASSDQTSEAKIEFTPGQIIVIPPGGYDDLPFDFINLDFGTRTKPARREVYFANGDGGSDVGATGDAGSVGTDVGIAVTDARDALTTWRMKVTMGAFKASGQVDWVASIALLRGTRYSNTIADPDNNEPDASVLALTTVPNAFTHPYASQTAIYEANVEGVKFTGNGGAVYLLNGTNTSSVRLGNGTHGAYWNTQDIKMMPAGTDDLDWNKITPNAYTAEMVWAVEL